MVLIWGADHLGDELCDTAQLDFDETGVGDACECRGNFDGDSDIDGKDAYVFKVGFGRSEFFNPCPVVNTLPTTSTTTTDLPSTTSTTVIGVSFFMDNGDGTVTDNDSGLIWLKDGDCSTISPLNWSEAIVAVGNLMSGQCGLTDGSSAGDWRLPTKEEWESFVCSQYSFPSLCNTDKTGQWSEGDPFVNVAGWTYWAGTEESVDTVWSVNLNDGTTYTRGKTSVVWTWPVRNAQ